MKAFVRCGRQWAVVAALAGMLTIGAGAARAATVYVSPSGNDANDGMNWATAKKTVQAGLNVASAGDQVWVAAGTYVERIILKSQVALYGGFAGGESNLDQRNWSANVTVLDGDRGGSVVTVPGGAASTTRIDGFTIRNGTGTHVGLSYTYGGGVYCGDGSPTIANNVIVDNGVAGSASYGGGGGIYCRAAIVLNNVIRDNRANTGGGLQCSSSAALIANNVIVGNSTIGSSGGGVGGGIYCYFASPSIVNNTIAGNLASAAGGGIYLDASSPTIANNIVAFNSSGLYGSPASKPGVLSNCVYGNVAYNWSGQADATGTNGNISVDPQLAGLAYGNVHIRPGSPCIDGGNDGSIQAGWTDMDAQPRKQGARVDIGADESDGTSWPTDPSVVVRVSPDGDDANDGSSWALAKRTVQAAIDAAASGGEVWVRAGTYTGTVSLRNYVHVYGGFAGTETGRASRDPAVNKSILDGGQNSSVVTASRLPGWELSTIDGFVIRNGNGRVYGASRCGGGVFCFWASPRIAGNTITANSATYGGGIYCEFYAYPRIMGNLILGNNALMGGGIQCENDSGPAIIGNRIMANAATSGNGGGIYCNYANSTVIANNMITGNSAAGNSSWGEGGGICCEYASATIANNTILGNAASWGGGLYCYYSRPVMPNNVIAFNSSGIYRLGSDLDKPTVSNSCVYGNRVYDCLGMTSPTGTNGNISADPLFVSVSPGLDGLWGTADDMYNDLRLLPWSPCIDAGSNAGVPADSIDLDGDGNLTEPLPVDLAGGARFLDDPQVVDTGASTAPIADMGAYERCRPVGDVDGDWLTDVVDLLYMVDAFGTYSGDTGYDPRCDFNGDGAVDVVDLLDIVYNFGK